MEHPVIHVVFKRDEHLFRDEVDDVVMEEERTESSAGDSSVNIGDVMSDTSAMETDPEAYKQYFDFYLKYYTQKYAQQPGQVYRGTEPVLKPGQVPPAAPPTLSLPPPGVIPNMTVPPPILQPNPHHDHHPHQGHHANQNTFPARTVPPPTKIFRSSNTGTGNRTHSNSGQVAAARTQFRKRANYLFSEDDEDLNQKNQVEARSIQNSLRSDAQGSLSSLVQYDLSDSDCEN